MKRGWKPTNIGELLTIQNGFAFDSKGFSESRGVPLIRIRDLKNGLNTETRYDGSFDKRYKVKSGDLLIGMDGEFGCYEWRGAKALLNQRVCRLEGFSGKLEPKFLFYRINKYLKEIEETTTYTTVKHLSSKQIANIEIPLPPLSEQKRIVAILNEAFAGLANATANAENNLKNARELFESYLTKVFAEKGKGWVRCQIGDVATTQYGLSGTLNSDGEGYRIFRMGEVQDGRVVDTGRMKFIDVKRKEFEEYRLRRGDVLFNRTNSSALVGKTGLFDLEGDYCFASYLVRVNFDSSKVNSRFAAYLMNTSEFLARIRTKAARSVNQANINATILRNELIDFPGAIQAQAELAAKFDSLFLETQRLEQSYKNKVGQLADLKQTILRRAFSGELTSPPSQTIKEAAE